MTHPKFLNPIAASAVKRCEQFAKPDRIQR